MLNIAMLGSVDVHPYLSQAYKESIEHHHNQAKKKDTLSKIINSVKFCGFHEVVLRGHDESEE